MPEQKSLINSHTAMPGRKDLIRLGIGIIGIGVSGPLIALSTMPVVTLIFWRNLGGALVIAPFAFKHRKNRDAMPWAVLGGFVLAMHFIAFFLAMRLTTVAAGTALVALQPIFAALFLRIRGGHIPSRAWLGMVVSFSGVLLISGVDLTISLRSFAGDVAAIISAALAAIYVLIGSKAQQSLETSSYTAICYATCALTALPIMLIGGFKIWNFSGNEWWLVIGLIVFAQLLGHNMFNSALKRVSPAVVSLIIFFEVPVASVLAIWWLNQTPPIAILPGIILILGGCALVVLRTRPLKAELLHD
jgi:drug/metabolite transporter (DMT)-like permease